MREGQTCWERIEEVCDKLIDGMLISNRVRDISEFPPTLICLEALIFVVTWV